jgi:hypothetical protein
LIACDPPHKTKKFLKLFPSGEPLWNSIFLAFAPLPKEIDTWCIMEVITIDSKAFKELIAKINVIAQFVTSYQSEGGNTDDDWVDSYEVSTFLSVSQRTLQRLRAANEITYTNIRGRNYYKIGDIKRMMEEKKIRSTSDRMEDLITNHKLNVQKRRDSQQDK